MNGRVKNYLFWGKVFKDGKKRSRNQKDNTIKINNSNNFSVHGPSTNTDLCILKEKLEILAFSEDSPLGKTTLDMEQQFVHCLEELYMREGEVK